MIEKFFESIAKEQAKSQELEQPKYTSSVSSVKEKGALERGNEQEPPRSVEAVQQSSHLHWTEANGEAPLRASAYPTQQSVLSNLNKSRQVMLSNSRWKSQAKHQVVPKANVGNILARNGPAIANGSGQRPILQL